MIADTTTEQNYVKQHQNRQHETTAKKQYETTAGYGSRKMTGR